MNYGGVAISGKAGAGKNAFASVLGEVFAEQGLWGTDVAFAGVLNRLLWERHGMVKADPGGRDKLFEIGAELRNGDPDFLIKALADECESLRPYGLIPIITDLRYLSEYEWVADNGFLTVRIDATVIERESVLMRRGEDLRLATSEHASETELDTQMFDVRFLNQHSHVAPLYPWATVVASMLVGEFELV